MTFSEYAEHWLAAQAGVIAPRTLVNYRYGMSHALPVLGSRELSAVDRSDVRELLTRKLAAGLAPGTVKLIRGAMRACFSEAVAEGLILRNPAAALGSGMRRALGTPRRPTYATTPEEVAALLDVAWRDWPQLYPVFLCLARTGVRVGEAIVLEWRHLDLKARTARIEQTWNHCGVGPVKGRRPYDVDLSAELVAVLKRVRRHGALWQFLLAPTADNPIDARIPWVFPSPRGTPWHVSWVEEIFRRCAKAAGLPPMTPKALRHGFATTLLERRAPLRYVQQALNHRDPKLTASLYGKHRRIHGADLVDALDGSARRPTASPVPPAPPAVFPVGTTFKPVYSRRLRGTPLVARIARVEDGPHAGTWAALVLRWPRNRGEFLDQWLESPPLTCKEEAAGLLASFLASWVPTSVVERLAIPSGTLQ